MVIKGRLNYTIIAGLLLISLYAFTWSIIDRITLFLYLPLAAVVWGLFIGAGIASLTCIRKFKDIRYRSLIPAGVCCLSILIVIFVPFTTLWLELDYWIYKKERQKVVRLIKNGELRPNVAHNHRLIKLGIHYPNISVGGNEVVVEAHGDQKYVLFFTFRGILDNYAGFLYVPKDGSPSRYSDLHEKQVSQIIPLDKNWYYVSHR